MFCLIYRLIPLKQSINCRFFYTKFQAKNIQNQKNEKCGRIYRKEITFCHPVEHTAKNKKYRQEHGITGSLVTNLFRITAFVLAESKMIIKAPNIISNLEHSL